MRLFSCTEYKKKHTLQGSARSKYSKTFDMFNVAFQFVRSYNRWTQEKVNWKSFEEEEVFPKWILHYRRGFRLSFLLENQSNMESRGWGGEGLWGTLSRTIYAV